MGTKANEQDSLAAEHVPDRAVLSSMFREKDRRTRKLGILSWSSSLMLWWVRTSMALRYIYLDMNDKRIVHVASFSSLWWRRRQPTWLFSTKCGGGSTRFHGEVYLVVLWMREKFRSSNPDKGVRIWQLPNPIRSIPKTTTTMTIRTTELPTMATGIAASFVP